VRRGDHLRLTLESHPVEYPPATLANAQAFGHCSLEDTFMKVFVKALLGAVALAGFALPAHAETTLNIATVNNSDMIIM
jgi:hypothetical protein